MSRSPDPAVRPVERAPSRTALLGIDLGTTEAKAGLFALDGEPLGTGRAGYPTDHGPDGRAEQDPSAWWEAVAIAVRGAVGAAPAGTTVAAICPVGQGPTLAVLDDEARPVRPAITWQDRRAGDGGFGLLPRVAWLAGAEPAAIGRARWLMSSWDALGLWLTGHAATSLQGHDSTIDARAARDAGVAPDRIPPSIAFGRPLGILRPPAAGALGLPVGTPVIAGVNDGTASMLGAGLREPGDAVDTGGASGGFGVYAARELVLPATFCAPAPIPGRWVVGGAMAATGAALDWLGGILGAGRLEDEDGLDGLLDEAAGTPPGAAGLVFLPYLSGERAPIFDETARGAFVGLTLAHTRGHLVRAVLEGAAFALRHVAEPIVGAGVHVREMRLAGRTGQSPLWAHIKADVTGFPVAVPRVPEAAVLGAAILAAAGAGLAPDLATGVEAMAGAGRRIEPDRATRSVYDAAYARYRALYPALRDLPRP